MAYQPMIEISLHCLGRSHSRRYGVSQTLDVGLGFTAFNGVNAVRANVQLVVKQLKGSKPILSEQAGKGKIKIVGAVYELASGKVTLLSD
jgi:carbonic anhydrase